MSGLFLRFLFVITVAFLSLFATLNCTHGTDHRITSSMTSIHKCFMKGKKSGKEFSSPFCGRDMRKKHKNRTFLGSLYTNTITHTTTIYVIHVKTHLWYQNTREFSLNNLKNEKSSKKKHKIKTSLERAVLVWKREKPSFGRKIY